MKTFKQLSAELSESTNIGWHHAHMTEYNGNFMTPIGKTPAEALDHAHQSWRRLNNVHVRAHNAYDSGNPEDREAMNSAKKMTKVRVSPKAKEAIEKHAPADEFSHQWSDGEHGLKVDWKKKTVTHESDK